MTTILNSNVMSVADLNSAIAMAATETAAGTYEIDLTADITLSMGGTGIAAINIGSGITLDIVGGGHTIHGGGAQRGLFVYSGAVTIENLTISDTAAFGGSGGVADGSAGSGGGGGGAGLGGALYIANDGAHGAAPGNVTLTNVIITNSAAIGGKGAAGNGGGGGGGLGGAGGATVSIGSGGLGGGGGGVGALAGGGDLGGVPAHVGIVTGAAGGGQGGTLSSQGTGGASGGGGGSRYYGSSGGGGGGGGVGGSNANQATGAGGNGGYGGGGGGSYVAGGDGGFGGGGGGGGGKGSFGGGGGGGNGGGAAGFGAGAGTAAGGGGGLGAGGDIFVQGGATLTISGSGGLDAGTITGGTGGGGAAGGGAYGSAIFLQGNQSITFSPGAGQTQTISGSIADQTGSGGTGVGAVVIDGLGTVVLSGANTFTGGIQLDSGTLELSSTSAAGTGAITFGTSSIDPTIIIDAGDTPANGATFATALNNFGDNDNLDIKGLTFAPGSTSVTLTGSDLAVSNGAETIHFTLTGTEASQYYVYDDGTADHGVLVNDDPACYCRGTLVLTDRGQVPVEDLRIGDRLVTFDGTTQPLKWIGRRSYLDWAAIGNADIQPILFKTGSLADNIPSRDLMVSPEHAMFLDGVLIPARLLVNGVSVLQMRAMDEIHYFHLELEHHAVIFAEGAASETFVDDDSRGMFHNVYEFHALYPDAPRGGHAEYCAPRVEDGVALEAVRRALRARAGTLSADGKVAPSPGLKGYLDCVTRTTVEGWAFDPQTPDRPVRLAVLVDGAVIGRVVADAHRPDLAKSGIGSGRHAYRFELPRGFAGDVGHKIEVRRESDWSSLVDSPAILPPGAAYASSRVRRGKGAGRARPAPRVQAGR